MEVDRLVDDLRGAQGVGYTLQALIRHTDDGDVRLDGGEGVVAGLCPGRSQGVEQRRLPRVGHADDPDPHRHRFVT
jgi:hypothetical protein